MQRGLYLGLSMPWKEEDEYRPKNRWVWFGALLFVNCWVWAGYLAF